MTAADEVVKAFEERYGEAPAVVVRTPGRVNLIGGHTGYSGGYVLALPVDRYVVIALRAREDGNVTAHSTVGDEITFDLENFERAGGFGDLIKASAWALGTEGFALRGWEGVIGTDIPVNADLAVDSATLLGVMFAFSETSGFVFEPKDMAKIADKAYTDFVGKRSNLPDLYGIALSKPNHGILLDMQSLNIEDVPQPREARVVLMDTGVEINEGALDGAIRERVEQFAGAARNYKVSHLRDLSMSRFEKDMDSLEEPVGRRARHFLTENGRTILAGEMLRSGALATVGKLMSDSHKSLRDDYEVYDETLEAMVNCAMEQPNVFGARWSGFGGAAVALVRDFSADTMSKLVTSAFKKATGSTGKAMVLGPAEGIARL